MNRCVPWEAVVIAELIKFLAICVGTTPNDPASRFTVAAEGLGIAFTRLAGRTYEVQTATDPGGPWEWHADISDGEGRIVVPPPAAPGPRRFYRVVIRFIP